MAQVTVQPPSLRVQKSHQIVEKQTQIIPLVQKNGKISLGEKNGHSRIHTAQVSYSVVHQIQGRIRLRVPRLRYDADYAQRLLALVEGDPLFSNVRIKPAAAALVVNYPVSSVADAKVRSRLSYLIGAATEVAIVVPKANNSLATQPTEDAENSWPGMQLSAMATGLAVLGGPLGLPIPPLIVAGTIALATLPVFQRAVEGIVKERKLNIDFLDFLAIAITTVQGQFLTPSLMLSLIEIGENIRDRTARSSKLQTLDLLSSLGQFAWVERNGVKEQIPIQDVQRGDTVIVYPGEQVPVDGTILRGKALLDEQKLTGESMPVLKRKGQPVFGSTLMREGRIYILAEWVGNDTRAGQSIKLMQEAPVHDTRMENYAIKIAEKAVVPTLLLGAGVFAATRNPARVASVLTLDLCTGIRVSIPTTVLAALTYAAKHGILIRSGRALEQLAAVDTVVFDKTGTLTKGEVSVVKVESLNAATSDLRVLELAAAAEQRLTHPVAEAVIRYAEAQQIAIPSRSKWDYQLGLGVQAEIDGETVYVGSERFLRQQGIDMEPLNGHKPGDSVIYVASNNQLQGRIVYSDILRPESQKVITQLLTVDGVEVHMLTGDNKRTANAVAAQLGIAPKHTHAEAFPEQKATVVRQLHEQGKTVAFVGDGINDSPALAYADVSVSFANGSEIARETADVVLMQNDLHGLLEAIAIARKAKQIIHQNTSIVALPNIAAMIVAVFFGLNPLAATVVNNGSTVVAGVNGLRPILKPSPKKALPSAR
ncbi:heavy metal translocating P-type ATPase [Nostoc punctiforme FACHB-252]|uniref:Heavy metal translocating P-type ATPase n=1 Tax=Nostoc punctiforme FACHB-252 TaxID=1357509 RepID=A0ABR8HK67_NOSPU|nr:heavy metal translocating P-type ATPase [Nostoc punctiforme]MBD2615781.1 heavy metal translocating P-type ATPase [Nostoc punctiforme FACHB-252]